MVSISVATYGRIGTNDVFVILNLSGSCIALIVAVKLGKDMSSRSGIFV